MQVKPVVFGNTFTLPKTRFAGAPSPDDTKAFGDLPEPVRKHFQQHPNTTATFTHDNVAYGPTALTQGKTPIAVAGRRYHALPVTKDSPLQ